MEALKALAQEKWVQLLGALALGVTVGAVFYPTKTVTEKERTEIREAYELKEKETQERHSKEVQELQQKLTLEEQSHKQYQEQTSAKIQTLITENSSLKSSSKKQKFKLIKPDGTIVEKEIEESNSEAQRNVVTSVRQEFDRKVQSIEDKWKKVHEERVVSLKKEYDEKLEKAKSEIKVKEVIIEKEKIVEVNKKKLRPEVGVTTNKDIYLHGSYTVWGPVFVGGGVSGTDKSFGDARLGVGLEF